jgi:hypothetical protein
MDPSLDEILDSVRDRLEAWRARDERKAEQRLERQKKSARYASWKASIREEVTGNIGKETRDAAKFYLRCKAADKERLWDRLLNRPPKKPKRAKKVRPAKPEKEPTYHFNVAKALALYGAADRSKPRRVRKRRD